MKAEFINPFVTAAFSVLQTVLGETPSKGQIAVQSTSFTSEQVNVLIGVTGQAVGGVIFGMSLVTADRIASTMVGTPIKSFDSLAASAISELGNMISGHALQGLSQAGFVCDIAPPTVFRGTKIQISTMSSPSIIVPLSLSHGMVSLSISLNPVGAERAA